MFREFGSANITASFTRPAIAETSVARSGDLDALIALEQIGTRRLYRRDEEVYAEGDVADGWYKVISGAVRITKQLADGRRHVAEFFFAGDCFGFDNTPQRLFSAEAIGDAIVMRFSRAATDRLIDEYPRLARRLCAMTLRDLAHAQTRTLLLGRMTAPERVGHFLIELAERRDAHRLIDVPMSRTDIADYLGLTIETVCRVLSILKRDGMIATPMPHQIELRDRKALAAMFEA
jgi:CRP/FNR family transcriptional regulator, nitrogen fixation regulation protein